MLVLDGGLRSEPVRKGRFRFEAVRSGSHALELLAESLPDGASILTDRLVTVTLGRERLSTTVDFLVKVEKRPEVRRVFPPKGGSSSAPAVRTPARGSSDAAARRTAPASSRKPSTPPPARTVTITAVPSGPFTIQIAALSQLSRARALAATLEAAGHAAYVIEPPDDDPNGLYRVRAGRFASREDAEKVLPQLEALRGEKFWVIRAR